MGNSPVPAMYFTQQSLTKLDLVGWSLAPVESNSVATVYAGCGSTLEVYTEKEAPVETFTSLGKPTYIHTLWVDAVAVFCRFGTAHLPD